MSEKTCFVIMPIGNQKHGDIEISASELKARYNDLIKVAINNANSELTVIRADEFPISGSISKEILTYLMHADYVIADISYPNPNVFYELGLRHAVRSGTILIKDSSAPRVPFDINHLKYYEYENTPSGLKNLSDQLKEYFSSEQTTTHPDNDFLYLAQFTKYRYPDFSDRKDLLEEYNYLKKKTFELEKHIEKKISF